VGERYLGSGDANPSPDLGLLASLPPRP